MKKRVLRWKWWLLAIVIVAAYAWYAVWDITNPYHHRPEGSMERVELGSAFGIYTAAFEGGIVFGAMVMGPVVSALGFREAFAIIGCVCLAGAVFFIAAYRALTA